jgi:hypothetical protein
MLKALIKSLENKHSTPVVLTLGILDHSCPPMHCGGLGTLKKMGDPISYLPLIPDF